MARIIGQRWKAIDESSKAYYDHLAQIDRDRYGREMEAYRKQNETVSQSERRQSSTHTSSTSFSCTSSTSSGMSRDSSFLPSFADMEPIGYEPNVIDLEVHFDKGMIDILEKAFW